MPECPQALLLVLSTTSAPCLVSFCFLRRLLLRLVAASAPARRFIAARIKTSSSVKPRLVIFHMTASQLVRSIAALCKARVEPNVAAHASDGKARGLAGRRFSSKMLKGSKLSIALEAILKRTRTLLETFTRVEPSLLARANGDRNFACQIAGRSGLLGFCCFVVHSYARRIGHLS
jgi:hypothetical protein